MRAHPEVAPAVIDNVADDVARQTLGARNGGKAPLFEAGQAAVGGSNPEGVIRRGIKADNKVATQAIGFPKLLNIPILETAKTASGHAKPERAVSSLRNGAYIRKRKFVLSHRPGDLTRFVS